MAATPWHHTALSRTGAPASIRRIDTRATPMTIRALTRPARRSSASWCTPTRPLATAAGQLMTVPADASIARRPANVDVATAGAAPLAAITALTAIDALDLS